ncbi:MAG TPA: disulfide bond formation protein B [Fontimonas sp.]
MNFRLVSFLGALACIGGLAFALFTQYVLGFEPCPMCIFQRVAMAATGVFFILGAIHGPSGWGRWIYALLALLASAIGAGIAARHVWLQSLPPDLVPACGPTLDYLLEFLPVSEVISMVLYGDGNCAKIDAQWLGISLPGWTFMGFVALGIYALLTPIVSRRKATF